MVNAENMRLFIEALRSGEYQQGRSHLEYVDSHGVTRNCCLGVACRVAMLHGVPIQAWRKPGNREVRFGHEEISSSGAFLPTLVRDWLGVDQTSPILHTDGYLSTATRENDEMEKTFTEIADLFERTYLNGSE
jgi:hypothetical protein